MKRKITAAILGPEDEIIDLAESLGADAVLYELVRYLDSDTLEDFVETFKRNWDIN